MQQQERQGQAGQTLAAVGQQRAAPPDAGKPQQRLQLQLTPALAVLSGTLWHALNIRAADEYRQQLVQLGLAAAGYIKASHGGSPAPRLALMSAPQTFPDLMKWQDYRQHLAPAHLQPYHQATQEVCGRFGVGWGCL